MIKSLVSFTKHMTRLMNYWVKSKGSSAHYIERGYSKSNRTDIQKTSKSDISHRLIAKVPYTFSKTMRKFVKYFSIILEIMIISRILIYFDLYVRFLESKKSRKSKNCSLHVLLKDWKHLSFLLRFIHRTSLNFFTLVAVVC